MVNHRNGLQLKQVFHKAQFWARYSSLFTLMISHKDCVAMQIYLLTTLHFPQQPLVLQHHYQILMKTHLKQHSGITSEKCRLIQI